MRNSELRTLCVLMCTVCSGFLLFCWWIWQAPLIEPKDQPILRWQIPTTHQTKNLVEAKRSSSFKQALSRPIFNPSRRPFQPIVVPEPVPQASAPAVPETTVQQAPDVSQVLVKGIIITAQEQRALVALPENQDGTWLKIGDDVVGWKLTNITSSGIQLSFNDQKQTLNLYVDNTAN